jgi:hypothetical protein
VIAGALVVGALGGWAAAGHNSTEASVRIVEGWGYQAGSSGGIGCCGESRSTAGGDGFNVIGATWRDLSTGTSSWHEADGSSPTCLGENEPVLLRLGVVDVTPHGHAPGGPTVIWLECL